MVKITSAAVEREIALIGVDLSKRIFQAHAIDRLGHVKFAGAMSVTRFWTWCSRLRAFATTEVG